MIRISILKHDYHSLTAHVNTVLTFYHSLFATTNNYQSNNLVASVISSILIQEDNSMMKTLPSLYEVTKFMFDMNGNSALGPYGFRGHFFQTYRFKYLYICPSIFVNNLI